MSYRVGDHSTSDFSAAYRDEKEMTKWTDLLKDFSDPIARLEKYLMSKNLVASGESD